MGAHLVTDKEPARQVRFQVEVLSCTNATVKRHPAHDFGRYKVLRTAPHLPDSAIRILPMCAYMLCQEAHQAPERAFNRFAVAFKTVQHFAKDIKLFLAGS